MSGDEYFYGNHTDLLVSVIPYSLPKGILEIYGGLLISAVGVGATDVE